MNPLLQLLIAEYEAACDDKIYRRADQLHTAIMTHIREDRDVRH